MHHDPRSCSAIETTVRKSCAQVLSLISNKLRNKKKMQTACETVFCCATRAHSELPRLENVTQSHDTTIIVGCTLKRRGHSLGRLLTTGQVARPPEASVMMRVLLPLKPTTCIVGRRREKQSVVGRKTPTIFLFHVRINPTSQIHQSSPCLSARVVERTNPTLQLDTRLIERAYKPQKT